MFNIFNREAISAIAIAQQEARHLRQDCIGQELLFLGLFAQGDGIATKVLRKSGLNLRIVQEEIEKEIGQGTSTSPSEIPFAINVKSILEQAVDQSRQWEQDFVGSEHLLLALLNESKSSVARIL